jgi:hypothetical protein
MMHYKRKGVVHSACDLERPDLSSSKKNTTTRVREVTCNHCLTNLADDFCRGNGLPAKIIEQAKRKLGRI